MSGSKKSPYKVVKHLHMTEKSMMLQGLKNAESNPSLRRFNSLKYVFIVDRLANKKEIAAAVEEIYKEESVEVVSVNTINVKPKAKRVRGRQGFTKAFKKAIVTLRPDDKIENV